jgi:hypothetical protein
MRRCVPLSASTIRLVPLIVTMVWTPLQSSSAKLRHVSPLRQMVRTASSAVSFVEPWVGPGSLIVSTVLSAYADALGSLRLPRFPPPTIMSRVCRGRDFYLAAWVSFPAFKVLNMNKTHASTPTLLARVFTAIAAGAVAFEGVYLLLRSAAPWSDMMWESGAVSSVPSASPLGVAVSVGLCVAAMAVAIGVGSSRALRLAAWSVVIALSAIVFVFSSGVMLLSSAVALVAVAAELATGRPRSTLAPLSPA